MEGHHCKPLTCCTCHYQVLPSWQTGSLFKVFLEMNKQNQNKIKTKLKKRSTQIISKHICLQACHISERWSKCGHRKCWYTLRLPSLTHTQYLALNVRTGLCCLVLYFNKSLTAGWQPNNQRRHYAVYIEGLQVLQLFPRSTQLVIDSIILPFFGYSMYVGLGICFSEVFVWNWQLLQTNWLIWKYTT